MHPDITADGPAECSTCGMKLVMNEHDHASHGHQDGAMMGDDAEEGDGQKEGTEGTEAHHE